MKNIGVYNPKTQGFIKGKLPKQEISLLETKGWRREVTGYLRPDVDLLVPSNSRPGGAKLVKVDIPENTAYWFDPSTGSVILEDGGNPTDLVFVS